MNTAEFDYHLPKELIAQEPAETREASRLLVFDRKTGAIEHLHFHDIVRYFHPGDVLVINNSKVFPARLPAKKLSGGALDILLVEEIQKGAWECLVKGLKKTSSETRVSVGEYILSIQWDDNRWIITFPEDQEVMDILTRFGRMPLPNYIKRNGTAHNVDLTRYQTVYAEETGSIAAPTAGFHFTDDLLEALQKNGTEIVKITLHIGIGTFLLIKSELIGDHRMHREYYSITPDAVTTLRSAKSDRRRIVACGTSAVRSIESIFSQNGDASLAGYTELFIYPGYSFRAIDALITNFHLPRSTPLALATAFAGKENLLSCYREAISKRYRFYSYGDTMLIL